MAVVRSAVTRQAGRARVCRTPAGWPLVGSADFGHARDTVGNSYAISSGLKPGDKVIVSSTQFLVNGHAVMAAGA